MLAILVHNLKETVTLMTNVRKVSDVEQTIVQFHLDLKLIQIVVILQLLGMMIFAQLINLVKSMKGTVILMMNAKAIYFVDQIIALIHLTAVYQKVIKN